jgi:hypothetical protein
VKLRAQSEPWWTISRQKVVSPVKSDAGCVCEVDDFGGSLEFRRAGREGKRGTWRQECHRAAFGAVCRPPAELMYCCSLSPSWYMHPRIAGVVLRKPRMKQAREQKVVEGQVTFGRVNRGRSWTPDRQCRRSCAGRLHKQAPLFSRAGHASAHPCAQFRHQTCRCHMAALGWPNSNMERAAGGLEFRLHRAVQGMLLHIYR